LRNGNGVLRVKLHVDVVGIWTSIRVHLRAKYVQLKGRRSVNTRRTFSKFWQHREKVHRYKICNAQREIV